MEPKYKSFLDMCDENKDLRNLLFFPFPFPPKVGCDGLFFFSLFVTSAIVVGERI